MRHAIIALCVTAGCLLLLTAPRAFADNILVNGSFGTGDFTGWTNNGDYSFVAASGTWGYNSEDAGDGCSTALGSPTPFGCFAALGNDAFGTGPLSQSFTDNNGGSYIFSFYFAADGNTPSSFEAEWNGMDLLNLVNPPASANAQYGLYAYQVTGTGNDTISFNSEDDFGYLALDAVSVCSSGCASPGIPGPPTSTTPEPPTLALIAVGLLLLAPSLRRRFLPAA